MPDPENCPNPLSQRDAIALIGLTAVLNGLVAAGHIHPNEIERLRSRLRRDGVIAAGASALGVEDVSGGLEALNQRLRWVLGEYDSMPA